MLADLQLIFIWWATIFILGMLSWVLVFNVFGKFWDKGYIFSKIVSVGVLTYIVFITGVAHILPFYRSSLFLLMCFALLANVFYLIKGNKVKKFKAILKDNWRYFLFEEVLFFIILMLWSFVRGYSPDIEGLEKFMDWGFVNSALRSKFMPPTDMWFSGMPINYYYFGQLMSAVVTKLSGISSIFTYNLSIATLCALTFVSGFSISSNLIFNFLKKHNWFLIISAGLVSALILTFGGNLHALYKISTINIKNNGYLSLKLDDISKAANSYWYPDATRFIGFDPETKDKTIHEFPIYSFVVADLHGHLNDVPVILFFIAFLFALSLRIKESFFLWQLIIPSGLILSVAYMTNAWDFAVYGLLYAITTFLLNFKKSKITYTLAKTLVNGIFVIIFWYIFTFPFSLNFIPMAEGLRLADSHSPFYQLFILYGGFWLILFPFLLYLFYQLIRKRHQITSPDIAVVALILTATLLIIIPEIGYIKDIYIYEHRRANTMFKLVYEAFIMYSLVTGYVLVRLSRSIKSKLSIISYKFIFLLVFVAHMIYPYFAIKSFYILSEYKGLWGLGFLERSYPDNLQAINWINQNISGQPVMLEATGDSYTTFNQVSVATGLPTVEGWIVHEWLWRGGYDQPAARQMDVQKIYEAEDKNQVSDLIKKYQISYIFVGDKEREKYPNLNERSFEELNYKIAVQFGQTKIYKTDI